MKNKITQIYSGSRFFGSLILFLSIVTHYGVIKGENLEIESDSRFEVLIDSSEYFASKKEWVNAERVTIEALRLKPANKANWLLWANLAEIRMNKPDYKGAETAYNIAISLKPDSKKLRQGRASLLISCKRNMEALEDLNKILESDSLAEWPRVARAMIYLEDKKNDEAEKDFTYIIEKNPECYTALNGLATIYTMRGDFKQAIESYSRSLELNPDDFIYFCKISLLADNGQLSEASEELRDAMKKFPRNGNLYVMRAYLHKLNFQNNEAEIALKLAKEYDADAHLIETYFPKNTPSKRK